MSARHPRSVLALGAVLALAACDRPAREPPTRAVDRAPPERGHDGPSPDAGPAVADASTPAAAPIGRRCVAPDLPVRRTAACVEGRGYPDCRFQLPDPEAVGGLYDVWRNTVPEHRWGRESLVGLVLATARDYADRYPGEKVTVGDLDAPGPRHKTHRHGVDLDLYLPGKMATENRGSRDYPSNYDGRPEAEVEASRERVLELSKIVATCAGGAARIYYNDPPVVERYAAWFEASGLDGPFRRPMEPHNLLHLFHLHVTVVRALEPLEVAGRPGLGFRDPAVAPEAPAQ